MNIARRKFIGLMAAPFVVTIPGILMPVSPFVPYPGAAPRGTAYSQDRVRIGPFYPEDWVLPTKEPKALGKAWRDGDLLRISGGGVSGKFTSDGIMFMGMYA